MIFVSYGLHVINHFKLVNRFNNYPYVIETLQKIVDDENLNLSKMIPLNKVYLFFIILILIN